MDDQARALERAKQLVALATNAGTTIDEQRNAALAAVRLIAKYGLLDAPRPAVGGAHGFSFSTDGSAGSIEDVFRFMQDFFGDRPRPAPRRPRPGPTAPPRPPSEPPSGVDPRDFRLRVDAEFLELRRRTPPHVPDTVLLRAAEASVRESLLQEQKRRRAAR